MSGWLERLFLGREAMLKLDEARKRLTKDNELSLQTEQQQQKAIRDLCSALRTQSDELSKRPATVIVNKSVPDFEGI